MICSHSTRLLSALFLLAGGWGTPSLAGPDATHPALAAWKNELLERIAQPRFENAHWGIKVVSLDSGRTLFERNARKYFQPASNAKLFTAALVLDRLGPEYRIRTTVTASTLPDADGAIDGDVCVYGRGDPTFSTAWREGGVDAALQPLVSVLTNAGVRTIKGDLIGDESYFEGMLHGAGWMWEDLEHGYGSPLSALSLDGNLLKLQVTPGMRPQAQCPVSLHPAASRLQIVNNAITTVDAQDPSVSARRILGSDTVTVSGHMRVGAEPETLSVPVWFPAEFFMQNLAASLDRHGIELEGRVRVRSRAETSSAKRWAVGTAESPPASEMVRRMMKDSHNHTASLLLAHVGRRIHSAANQDPEETGALALNEFLTGADLPADEVQIEEGSGLSRNSLVTPNSIVAMLVHMHEHDAAEDFIVALPVAGVDGTLAERFIDTAAQGNLHAKTGTLRWAQALSGYVTSQAGEELAFSILLNRYRPADSGADGTDEVDAVALHIAALPVRSGNPQNETLTPATPETAPPK